MNHHVKNICALVGFVSTLYCITEQPQLVRWMLSAYIIYLIALWLGNDEDE